VKPFSFARFLKACNKARDYYELKKGRNQEMKGSGNAGEGSDAGKSADIKTGSNYFFVKTGGRIEKVFYNDLVHVEAMLNYVVLHTTHGKMIVYHTIKGILEQLPADTFLKVHKSSIVNVTKIRSIEGNEIDLGTTKVTISQNSFENTMKAILKDRMMKR
jgi:DNA-binding LytR/AlgR family response regulator